MIFIKSYPLTLQKEEKERKGKQAGSPKPSLL
jgi:hypothetical protein